MQLSLVHKCSAVQLTDQLQAHRTCASGSPRSRSRQQPAGGCINPGLITLDHFKLLGSPHVCKVIRLRGWYMIDSRRRGLQWHWWSCGEISLGVHRLRIPASRRPAPGARLQCSVTLPFALERMPAERQHAPCRAPLRYRQSAPVHEHVLLAARFAAIGGIRRPRLLRAALGADADAVRFLLSATADMQDSEKYFRGRAR